MSSGTLHFPAILVTVTCNPRRCVRTPRERKDFSEQPPCFQTQEFTFPYEHSVHVEVRAWKSQRVTTTEDPPPNLRWVVLGFAAVHCCAYTLGYPSPKAPRDHLSLVFGRRGLLHKKAGTLATAEGSRPTNVRCKAPHLIKIILAYSPKKKRANPIEEYSTL